MDKLDTFVSELLTAKNMPDTLEAHGELLEKLNDRIDRAILEALPGDDFDKLEEAINSGAATEDEIKGILENANINAEEITTKVLENFRDEFLKEEE